MNARCTRDRYRYGKRYETFEKRELRRSFRHEQAIETAGCNSLFHSKTNEPISGRPILQGWCSGV
jgi:hypothetical protein